ncbi:type IX secretion system membrane protein PorP/SprF [Fulvivirga ligni]|uniref:type IX secretion system membrane protein PorP/SprF n=1 Tax=Fulvivirga ligni TaxID=2904246 RepID=UPI00351E5138
MIKRYTLSICLFMLILSAQAQQDAIISTYQFNQLPINPAYAGAHNFTNIDLHYRNQWGDVEGAPSSVFFSANTFLPSKNMGQVSIFIMMLLE